MSNDAEIEAEIQAKGLTAPRLTPGAIDRQIRREHYHRPPDTTLTICCLVLRNGFTVTGESACASPENFDAEIGRKIARQKAVDKIWELEGYLLCEKRWQAESAFDRPSRRAIELLSEALAENDCRLELASTPSPQPKPTVGRIVHFHQGDDDPRNNYGVDQKPWWNGSGNTRNHAAIITAASSDGYVNLTVFFADGAIEPRMNVPLLPHSAFDRFGKCAQSGWSWPSRD